MIANFSGGYYSLDMQIEPYDDGPVIDSRVYDYIDERVYAQTSAPVTMKLSLDNGAYFKVGRGNAVPSEVLALPEEWVKNAGVAEGHRQTVFVLKPEHSYMLYESELKK